MTKVQKVHLYFVISLDDGSLGNYAACESSFQQIIEISERIYTIFIIYTHVFRPAVTFS